MKNTTDTTETAWVCPECDDNFYPATSDGRMCVGCLNEALAEEAMHLASDGEY